MKTSDKIAVAAALAIVVLKWVASVQLAPFGDEAFYWQCAQRPAPAYVDQPFMTAMLVRLGTAVFGDNPFGLRAVFLLLGTLFPVLIYGIARREHDHAHALRAAVFSILIPGTGHLGLMAIPDVPHLVLTAAFYWAFLEASRKETIGTWLLVGLFGALGAMTHYRFGLGPIAVFLYLTLTSSGRAKLHKPGPWLAGLLTISGLLPGLIYNLSHDFEPLGYFLAGRHQAEVEPEALLQYLARQLILMSPLVYGFLLLVLWQLFKRVREGESDAQPALFFALLPIGLFFLASPFHFGGMQTAHWPIAGYIPLLPLLPGLLESKRDRLVGMAALPFAAVITVTAIGMLILDRGPAALREPFAGWPQITDRVQETLANWEGPSPLVVADNYKLGANLEIALGNEVPLYIMPHSKNYEHGRVRQYDRWGIGHESLREHVGREALVIVQISEAPGGTEERWMGHIRWHLDPMVEIDRMEVTLGGHPRHDLLFVLYRGTVIPKR